MDELKMYYNDIQQIGMYTGVTIYYLTSTHGNGVWITAPFHPYTPGTIPFLYIKLGHPS